MKNISEYQNKHQSELLTESTKSIKDYIIEVSNKSKTEGKPIEELIDEGLLSALVGGVLGGTAGKTIMEAVCKALGISEKSPLGSLLNSRMILTAVGAYLGYKW